MIPALTIYIPTARPCVANLLESLAPQLTGPVEVIVSDNTGEGESACAGLPVTYDRRRYNVGGDTNVLRGATVGTGEWLWVIGDDDLILPGAVDRVIVELLSNDPDRLILFDPTAPMPVTDWTGSLADLLVLLQPDMSLLVAATLITANVFRRSMIDVPFGLRMLDTHYPLMWGTMAAQSYAIAEEPSFTVGINPPVDPQRQMLEREWHELLIAMNVSAGCPMQQAPTFGWNFPSARLAARR